jgi:hypothetical protein
MKFLIKLCKTLNQNKIEYAVAGGWAVALHQIPRATFDVDLVLKITAQNFNNIEKILNQLGLVSQIPVNADQIFKFRLEYIQNKNLVAWNFINPLMPSEVVDLILTEDKNDLEIEIRKVGDCKIPVLSAKSLIQLKKKSNRPQDQEDIKWLQKLIS